MSAPDEELARDLEGLLEPAAASELSARLEGDPELRRVREELERVLAGPLELEPVSVPTSLQAWVAERAGQASAEAGRDPLAGADLEPVQAPASLVEFVRARARAAAPPAEGRDPLAEPLELEPVPVPTQLEAWAREQVAGERGAAPRATRPAVPPAGLVLTFPPAAGRLAAAALLLLSCGLGLYAVSARSAAAAAALASSSSRDLAARAEAEAREARQARETSAAALEAAGRRLEQAERRLGAREAELRQLEVTQAELVAAGETLRVERERLEGQLARAVAESGQLGARVAEYESALARSAGELRDARAELLAVRRSVDSPERVRLLEGRLASAEREARSAEARAEELSQALARRGGARPAVEVQVGAAVGVRRWDARGGWERVRRGDTLLTGDIIAGEGLQCRVQLAGRRLRLSPQLYVVAEGQLQPLPAAVASEQGALPTGSYRAAEPRSRSGPALLGAVRPR